MKQQPDQLISRKPINRKPTVDHSKVVRRLSVASVPATTTNVFDDAKKLETAKKWFQSWDAAIRDKFIGSLINISPIESLEKTRLTVLRRIDTVNPPVIDCREDFTLVLPQKLRLRIFLLLDPRALCRCSQVCWLWKYISEDNRLWQLKCEKLKWSMSDSVNTYVMPSWKLLFISRILAMKDNLTTTTSPAFVETKRTDSRALMVKPNRSQQLRASMFNEGLKIDSSTRETATKSRQLPTDKRASKSHPTTPSLSRRNSVIKPNPKLKDSAERKTPEGQETTSSSLVPQLNVATPKGEPNLSRSRTASISDFLITNDIADLGTGQKWSWGGNHSDDD